MLVLVDKQTCEIDIVNCGHKSIDPNNQLLFADWWSFYLWLYKYHCVMCGRSGSDVHHIVPKSRGKEALDWHNCVLLCKHCHNKVHAEGINRAGIMQLREKRTKVLTSYGREGFI